MASATLRLNLTLSNADALSADISALAEALPRLPKLRKVLLELGDLSSHVRYVRADDLTTVPAGELRIELQLSDALAELLRAFRAGEFDDL